MNKSLHFFRCQVSSNESIFVPLNDSQIGLFSLKSLKTEIILKPYDTFETKSLGMVMAMKPCLDKSKYLLAAYDGGLLVLWDIRTKKILSSLEVEQSPMCMDFNSTIMYGIVGSPCDNLQVSFMKIIRLLKKKLKKFCSTTLDKDNTSLL